MRKRNKIDLGWKAIVQKEKKIEKKKISWTSKYEAHENIDETIFEKIVKFMIKISLFFTISKKNFLNSRKKSEIIDTTYSSLSSPKFAFIPAGVGLFLFFSLIPIMILSLSMVNSFTKWGPLLTNKVLPQIIPGISEMFRTIQIDSTILNNTLLVLFIISSIFFATKGVIKFSASFVTIYNYESNSNWILKRIKSFIIIVGISFYFFVFSCAFLPVIDIVYKNISNNILASLIFYLLIITYLIIFGYIGFGLLFKFIPPFKLQWKYLNPGILTSLVPTILFVILFGSIANFLKYEKFGSIGTFIYALIFILYLSYFIHAGIIVNASYYKTYVSSVMHPKKSLIGKRIYLLLSNAYNYIFKRRS